MSTQRLSSTPTWPIDQKVGDEAVAKARRYHASLRMLDRERIAWLRRAAFELRASGCEAALHDRATQYEAAADRMERVLKNAESA